MQDSELYEYLEAVKRIYKEINGWIIADGSPAPEGYDWHGYLSGCCRAINEFVEHGPRAEYWMVYNMFNDDQHREFHEGLVTTLANAMKVYISEVDEPDERFIFVNPQY